MYKEFLDIYWQWYKVTEGIPPRINAVEGKALKAIIAYYNILCEGDEDKAIDLWNSMLQNWGKLPEFYQSQKDLKQINSNINAIIRNLKNARKNGISDAYCEQIIRDLYS